MLDNKPPSVAHNQSRGCCAPEITPLNLDAGSAPPVPEKPVNVVEDDKPYLPERHDPFDDVFRNFVVMPLLSCVPAWVSPNAITAFNVPVRVGMLYLAWRQNERPTPFGAWELFLRPEEL